MSIIESMFRRSIKSIKCIRSIKRNYSFDTCGTSPASKLIVANPASNIQRGHLGMRLDKFLSWGNLFSHQHRKDTVNFSRVFNSNLF